MGLSGAVRVGNWQEELVLLDTTGVRFAPNPRDKATSIMTQSRVIDHTDRMSAKDYQSTSRSTVGNPRDHPDFIVNSKVAPRKTLREKKMWEQVKEECNSQTQAMESEKNRIQFDSEYKGSFVGKDNFRESLILSDPKVRIQTKNKNYSVEPATTYYQYCVEKGKGSLNFPVSYIQSTIHPFRKTTAFSAEIRHPFARRVETNENYKIFPKVKDYRILKQIREKIVKVSSKVSFNDIIVLIWTHEEVGDTGVIPLSLLCELLASVEIDLAEEDIACLENALCPCGSTMISIIEFINLLRGVFTVHQQELISFLFDKIDAVGKGFVTKEDVEAAYNTDYTSGCSATIRYCRTKGSGADDIELIPDTLEQVLDNLQITNKGSDNGARGTAELFDFIEYYWNISALIDGNEVVFEELIRKQWNIEL